MHSVMVVAINDLRQVPHVAGKLIADKLALVVIRTKDLGPRKRTVLNLPFM